jgi:hypothetical protein
LRAVAALQGAVRKGGTRFLFEMATGTGKTLTAAAVLKLFMRTGNAKRVLFLVDRLELETRAWKAFVHSLKSDLRTVIYKENRDDWRKAEIVVTTVQSLLFNNKYRSLFSPTDFDLVISDEAHRSIGGNSRAVFEYFIGYKLGLTATPRDYLKKLDPSRIHARDPRERERRQLLDTYKTFGCEDGVPTFRYGLMDGVRDGYLLNPVVVDARTEITTDMLSEQGYSVPVETEDGDLVEQSFFGKDFEKKFFQQPQWPHPLAGRLSHRQDARLRDGGHDDHRLRLRGPTEHRLAAPHLLAHRLHPGKGTRDAQVHLPLRGARGRPYRAACQGQGEVQVDYAVPVYGIKIARKFFEKLRKAVQVDRRIALREILAKAFGEIDRFKTRDELLEEEIAVFVSIRKPDAAAMPAIRQFFKAYVTDGGLRTIIDSREFSRLADNPKVSLADVKALGPWRDVIPEYVKDYVPLNAYM